MVGFFWKKTMVLFQLFFYVSYKIIDFPPPSWWDWETAEWNSLAPWIGSWDPASHFDYHFGNRSQSISVSHLKNEIDTGNFEDKRENRLGFAFQVLKRKEKRVLFWWADSGFLWMWGLPSSWPSDEPFPCSLMTKQEVTPEVRMRSEDEPPWWVDRARENSHQHYRWCTSIKGRFSLLRVGQLLCVSFTLLSKEKK